jgi:hypothetical protein
MVADSKMKRKYKEQNEMKSSYQREKNGAMAELNSSFYFIIEYCRKIIERNYLTKSQTKLVENC